MSRLSASSRRALVIAGVAVSFAVAGLAWTQPAAKTAQPVRLAIVDLNRVLDGLTEAKDAAERVKAQGEEANKGLKELSERRNKLSKDLDMMKQKQQKVSKEIIAVLSERMEVEAQGKARKATAEQRLEFERGDNLRAIYLKIVDATEQIRAADGWDLVLRDDRATVPPDATPEGLPLTEREVSSIVTQRTILAAAKPVDITQQVIDLMNNAYRAGKPASGKGH
jgi:Skp family chaperone for outer membrane proteins